MLQEHIKDKESFDLSFYQDYLSKLYANLNRNRKFEEIYGYLDRSAAYLGKAILAKKIVRADFILPISWLFALSTEVGINLQDSLIRQYPGKCSHCLELQCVCLETEKKPLKPIPAYEIIADLTIAYEYVKENIKPYNFEKAVDNIKKIYTGNKPIWLFSGQWYHNFKIHEEIAEIHEAYISFKKTEGDKKRQKPIETVAAEIADTMAWLLAAWGILFPTDLLDNTFVDYYLNGCPECGRSPCICEPYDSRMRSLIDIGKIAAIHTQVSGIKGDLPGYKHELAEINRSLTEAIETQHEPTAKKAIQEVSDLFGKIRNSVVTSDEEPANLVATIDSILDASANILVVEEPMAKKKYVFVSYASENQAQAKEIHEMLEKKGHEVFLSENVKPGESWEPVIKRALKDSKLLVLLATPDSMKSDWVKREWNAAWLLDVPIVPVLYRLSIDGLPETLRGYMAIDFDKKRKILELVK